MNNFASRRHFLKRLSAIGAVGLLPGCQSNRSHARSSSWTAGVQLYMFGDAALDLEALLKAVSSIGYRSVELPGSFGRSARQLRLSLDRAGLSCPSVHVPLQRRSPDSWSFEDDLAKISEDMAILGANYVGIPIFARHDSKVDAYRAGSAPSADDWLRTAELLNDKALYLARSQIRLAYHNHGLEFLTLPDGRNGYDILLERTDAKLVDFELDIGWATAAGIDCRALLDRLGSRVRLLHVKDIKPGGDFNSMQATDFGKGVVRWDEIIPAIRRHGITQIFVEQEGPYASSALDSARIAYQFLSQARETPI